MTVLAHAPASVNAVPDVSSTAPHEAIPTARTSIPTLVVRGPLDCSSVARFSEQLEDAMAARPSRLVVDVSGCSFVDAGALAVLLEAHRRMSRIGGVLTLCGCSPRVLRLLSLTGLRRVFDLG